MPICNTLHGNISLDKINIIHSSVMFICIEIVMIRKKKKKKLLKFSFD